MTQRTIVILGGALSGPTAAARAREQDEHARIILVERAQRISFALAGLAFCLSGEVESREKLVRETAEYFRSLYAIDVRTQTAITKLDTRRRCITVEQLGKSDEIQYDALIFALGAEPLLPAGLPRGIANVTAFRTYDDLASIEETLRAQADPRVLILGGGPAGIEAADGLLRAGAHVTIVERAPALLSSFSPLFRGVARKELERACRVVSGTSAESFGVSDDRISAVTLSNGERVETDFVISTIGVSPRTELLKIAGAKLTGTGAAVVGPDCQTSIPGVFACGVCAAAPQVITGNPLWCPQAALADKSSQVAGTNAGGGSARLAPALASMVVRVGESYFARTGLSVEEAERHLGRDKVGITIVSGSLSETYVKESGSAMLQLIWSRTDGRILGAEGHGAAGIEKRIDVAAAAVSSSSTIDQIASIDLTYIPPVNRARDLINTAATVALEEKNGLCKFIAAESLHADPAGLGAYQVLDLCSETDGGAPALPGARSIPLEELRSRITELNASKPTLVVSRTGQRAYLGARILRGRGFAEVACLSGGSRAWISQ